MSKLYIYDPYSEDFNIGFTLDDYKNIMITEKTTISLKTIIECKIFFLYDFSYKYKEEDKKKLNDIIYSFKLATSNDLKNIPKKKNKKYKTIITCEFFTEKDYTIYFNNDLYKYFISETIIFNIDTIVSNINDQSKKICETKNIYYTTLFQNLLAENIKTVCSIE